MYKSRISFFFFFFIQGGLVARALLAKPGFSPSSVNAIITLATPHQAPGNLTKRYSMVFLSLGLNV